MSTDMFPDAAVAFLLRTETTKAVLREVQDERRAQDEKWGEQNHPDGTGALVPFGHGNRVAYLAEMAKWAKADCERAAARGEVTWKHILAEEFFEALCEDDSARLREELVQVAAVAEAWVEAIDRRGSA